MNDHPHDHGKGCIRQQDRVNCKSVPTSLCVIHLLKDSLLGTTRGHRLYSGFFYGPVDRDGNVRDEMVQVLLIELAEALLEFWGPSRSVTEALA